MLPLLVFVVLATPPDSRPASTQEEALQSALQPQEAPAPPPVAPKAPPPQVSVVTRSLLSGAAGAVAGPISLGVAYLLSGANTRFDLTFATAALGSMLVAGLAFTLHQVLGGRGEILLGFLASAALMAGAAGLSVAVNPGKDIAPILTVAIGSIPAAAGAVLVLEGTSPHVRSKPLPVEISVSPTGISGRF